MLSSCGSRRRPSLAANYIVTQTVLKVGVQLPRAFICSSGSASRVRSSTLAEAEGGRGGKAGGPASKEGERNPEEGS